ncbi:hypothetical protein LX86_005252 [Lentzea aerocolonigenes]|nr:hypothetical protein [Lentzea aerocolonigenes]
MSRRNRVPSVERHEGSRIAGRSDRLVRRVARAAPRCRDSGVHRRGTGALRRRTVRGTRAAGRLRPSTRAGHRRVRVVRAGVDPVVRHRDRLRPRDRRTARARGSRGVRGVAVRAAVLLRRRPDGVRARRPDGAGAGHDVRDRVLCGRLLRAVARAGHGVGGVDRGRSAAGRRGVARAEARGAAVRVAAVVRVGVHGCAERGDAGRTAARGSDGGGAVRVDGGGWALSPVERAPGPSGARPFSRSAP